MTNLKSTAEVAIAKSDVLLFWTDMTAKPNGTQSFAEYARVCRENFEKRQKYLKIEYLDHAHLTAGHYGVLVAVTEPTTGEVRYGWSRRNPRDRWNKYVGIQKALQRLKSYDLTDAVVVEGLPFELEAFIRRAEDRKQAKLNAAIVN